MSRAVLTMLLTAGCSVDESPARRVPGAATTWSSTGGTTPATTQPHTGTTTTSGSTTPTTVCDDLRAFWQAEYDALIASNDSCAVDNNCHKLFDLCVTGLGHCEVAAHVSLSQSALDQIEADFIEDALAAGCPNPSVATCDCYDFTYNQARCVDAHCEVVGVY